MKRTTTALTLGTAVLLAGCGITPVSEENHRHEEEMARIEKGYQEQRADLNRNGVNEIFYVIDGNFAIVEKDGIPAYEWATQNK